MVIEELYYEISNVTKISVSSFAWTLQRQVISILNFSWNQRILTCFLFFLQKPSIYNTWTKLFQNILPNFWTLKLLLSAKQNLIGNERKEVWPRPLPLKELWNCTLCASHLRLFFCLRWVYLGLHFLPIHLRN